MDNEIGKRRGPIHVFSWGREIYGKEFVFNLTVTHKLAAYKVYEGITFADGKYEFVHTKTMNFWRDETKKED